MEAFHVVGAGGIGCAVGYALLAAGARVTFVEADADKLAWGRARGVAVDGLLPRRAEFVPFAGWEPPAGATVVLTTKCYDNAAVLDRLPPSAPLLPIQNGFDPALQARPPHLEGVASFVSECLPGRPHTRVTRRGALHLGPHGAADGPRLRARARALAVALRRAPFTVREVPDILPFKYTKLMYNAALSPLASAAGVDNGDVLLRPGLRGRFFALLRENHAILTQAGKPLGKVGPLAPGTVAAILRRPWLANALAWAFYPGLRGTYCSMAGDARTGRTEVDHYNGYLIALAGDAPCPLNVAVRALLKRIERERLPPCPALVEEFLPQPNPEAQSPLFPTPAVDRPARHG